MTHRIIIVQKLTDILVILDSKIKIVFLKNSAKFAIFSTEMENFGTYLHKFSEIFRVDFQFFLYRWKISGEF